MHKPSTLVQMKKKLQKKNIGLEKKRYRKKKVKVLELNYMYLYGISI